MKTYFAETERIGFSRWEDGDDPLAVQLWGEEDVTRFICADGKFSEQDIHKRLQVEIDNQKQFQVQYWPLFEMATGELIGCCGLRPFPEEQNAYEIGFHLRKEFWGRGYAFEAASAVIQFGFDTLKAETLYAGHHPHNAKSGKLLARLGFDYIGDHFYVPTGLYHPSYKKLAIFSGIG
ncbi:GNAT family N-acetyltransferase [Gorillibacterium massiliense]|uniref:GNAT family N-acetyltransferase n=1 Tax=Gorillibacterium massiliense TaxID=1280390 RepID=UPI0004B464EA|nr:GNAT family N-acetyltransferase [Gorillibacterium massiliense]